MIDLETLDTYEEMLRNGELDACSQLELIEQCRTMLKVISDLEFDTSLSRSLDTITRE